jgi:hypothetical protein
VSKFNKLISKFYRKYLTDPAVKKRDKDARRKRESRTTSSYKNAPVADKGDLVDSVKTVTADLVKDFPDISRDETLDVFSYLVKKVVFDKVKNSSSVQKKLPSIRTMSNATFVHAVSDLFETLKYTEGNEIPVNFIGSGLAIYNDGIDRDAVYKTIMELIKKEI